MRGTAAALPHAGKEALRVHPDAAGPGTSDLSLVFALAWRDLRGGLRGFGVFIACIALGVMAIAAVASTARGLSEGLGREGRRILGGDIAVSLVQREASPAEREVLASFGAVSQVATLRAMANAGEKGSTLVELKAVDAAYPGIGALETMPSVAAGKVPSLLALQDGAYGAVADPVLLARLDLKVGDTILIGAAKVQVRASLVSEPDKVTSGVGFGPRLILSGEALRDSGLIQPGSLVRWTYRVILPQGSDVDGDVERAVINLRAAMPDAGWDIRSRSNAAPQVQRNVERFTQFLTLVGLTSLLIGGIGVANAVQRFVDAKRLDFATLKALGATGSRVVLIHFIEVMGMAAIGVAIGIMLGVALPIMLAELLKSSLPLPFEPALAPFELAGAALFGFLTAAVFAILPLGRAHDVPVSALFRDQVDQREGRPRWRYLLIFGLLLSLLVLAAIGLAYDRRIAANYVAAAGLIFIGLRLLATLLMAGARALPRPSTPSLRLALANVTRPGALTPSLVLSLGLGVALMVALSGIDSSLTRQLRQGLPEQAPSFFFLDIPTQEIERFGAFVATEAPQARLERVPMLRGRIVSLKNQRAEDIKPPEQAGWVLEGDRGITYAAALPEGSQITSGTWWAADYNGPPLLSFDNELAGLLGLAVGDQVTVNVLGRNLTARIANLRKVEWRRLGINFVMVFSPNAFAGAPYTSLATASFPGGDDATRDARLLKALAREFPAVTAVRVKDALDAVNGVVTKLGLAIRGASGLAILVSLLVLAGALASGQRARLYDAVILKTLGATRLRLLSAYALEYGVIGLASALVGVLFGLLASWAVVVQLMRFSFSPDIASMLGIALLAIVVAVGFGLGGTLRVLTQKPASHLRNL
jgi:putative ABC transport system permease protein